VLIKKYSVSVIVSKLNKIHNHEEHNNRTMARKIIKSVVKRSAKNDLYINPNKLIHHELRNTNNFTINLSIKYML